MLRNHLPNPQVLLRPSIHLMRPNSLIGPLGGTDRSELPYIYHHLRSGCILQVEAVAGLDQQPLFYQVRYGGLLIGILCRPLADRIRQLETEGRAYRVTISEVVREKYMPPTEVHVMLDWGGSD